MDINLWAVLVCGIMSMVLGFIWYGPLFGKKWMQINGVSDTDIKNRKDGGCKGMGKFYLIQFILSLIQLYGLAAILSVSSTSPIRAAVVVWIFFLIPMIASGAMWTGKSGKNIWAQFLIQALYQLILMILSALIITAWK